MYSDALIAAKVARLERDVGSVLPSGKLESIPVDHCHSMVRALEGIYDHSRKLPIRGFTPEEQIFVANERLRCPLDFAYFAQRYWLIQSEGQTLKPLYPLWESQRLILAELARQEESRWRSRHPDGLLCNGLKGRQLGFSTLAEALLGHRVVTQTYVKGLVASDVPQNSGSQGIFGMLELGFAHLPWWLKPGVKFWNTDSHLVLANGSSIIVESGKSMKGGLQEEGGQKGQLGRSKSQPLDEPILTPTGWKPMGSLRVGDYVIGSDGQGTRVRGVYPQGVEQIYRVTFSDGTWTRCSGDHLWTVQTSFMKWDRGRWRTQPLRELAPTLRLSKNGGHRYFLPLLHPVSLSDPQQRPLPIPPYALGLLLGDGGLTQAVRFSTLDQPLADALSASLPPGLRLRHVKGCDYQVSAALGEPNAWTTALRDLGLLGKKSTEKSIPESYRLASIADRVALLQGLLDTDGWSTADGRVLFGTSSPRLADEVCELIYLLGGTASCRSYPTTHARSYRIELRLPPGMVPFRLDRKLQRLRTRQSGLHRAMVSVVPDGYVETQCIAVDAPDRLYATRFGILTHNTYSVGHLTELSTWEYAETIDDALMPAIPQTPRTLFLKESTAKGRHNWWHEEWLATEQGLTRSFNIFIPWYAERSKYWLPCPADWTPSDDTLAFAARVQAKGPQYMRRSVSLSKEQLYWYELRKAEAIHKGHLYKFLEEYPAEPEEAFQYSGRSIFSIETMDRLERQAKPLVDLWQVAPHGELKEDREALLRELAAEQRIDRERLAAERLRAASALPEGPGPQTLVIDSTPE